MKNFKKKKEIKFMNTAFRDGFQSVYGARVKSDDYLPAIEATKEAGISWFEAGGGAMFQSLYFYSNEDAFAVMDKFRSVVGKDANLQTLSRGINLVGLESQPSEIIKLHAKLFKKYGITSIRNFDALNDVNNLIYSAKCITDEGLNHQVCITMMELAPGLVGAHDVSFYEKTLKEILKSGLPFSSICFKDASGTSVPSKVYETIKMARKILPENTFLHFHTHETAGVAIASYIAAIEAGVDAIDLSMAPVSGGTCQPDIVTMWHALRGTDYYLDIDIDKVLTAEDVLKDCMKNYFLPPESRSVEPFIPWSPMPGGALTANTHMLRDNNMMDKYSEIIKEMNDVVKVGGFGTSVTPLSQFYFQQAFNNVVFGKWKKITEGYGKTVLGYFGKTPVEPDKHIVKIASEQLKLEPTKKTPLEIDDNDKIKGINVAKSILEKEGLELSDENIFIVATCKEKGITFLKGEAKNLIRYNDEKEEVKEVIDDQTYNIDIDGESFSVKLNKNTATVNGKIYNINFSKEKIKENKVNENKDNSTQIKAPMPGVVTKIFLDQGAEVKTGDTIIVLEAMKMEIPIYSTKNGILDSMKVKKGDVVSSDMLLAEIR